MDFEFPPDTLMLRDMLQRFVKKEAQPLEMKYFTAGLLSPEERARLRQSIEQMGLWGITVPEEYGGGGLDLVTSCMIEEELGGTFIPIEIGDIPSILYICRDDQVGSYLETALEGSRRPIFAVREPGDGIDRTAGGLKTETPGIRPETWSTTAVPDEEGFILNGRKVLGISPEPDDFYILIAKAEKESQAGGLTAFLLDANCEGLSLSKNGEVFLSIKDCRVGRDSILGQVGGALAAGAQEAPKLVIRTGARYVGIVERLMDMALEHARDWVMFGAPLSTRPAVQRMLAEMRVDVESARWLVYHAAWLADEGKAVHADRRPMCGCLPGKCCSGL
jgi:acyl-CoA dehydrogenase